ncbi:MAG: fibronectin type III domain-containing protein [Saprospiraceae bacterium]
MFNFFTILLTFFLCCIVVNPTMAQQNLVIRNPYLQSATSSSMVIKWRTLSASDSKVWYGESPSRLLQSIEIDTLAFDHEVKISNLEPSKTYY